MGGAASATGVVCIGGPAPAGGLQVSLTTSDPAAAFPSVAASAALSIATNAVAASTTVAITFSPADVSRAATLELVPCFTMTGFTLAPVSQYGAFAMKSILGGAIPVSVPLK